ncbi:hypothetical protein EV356DRAFT_507818 [Viridothelium virens]|uniref:F-box domain-containing protein n=1 Tax=Viridothelium virens TaxID=1048519 RepID=A0A6A6GZP8_VIRVR|nr:hypothetical protein EV356DRAFT_507818 [Viridothelium virens]
MATETEHAPSRLHLLSLPYDIRHLIYEHLFPQDPQLYIHAQDAGFASITPNFPIPTSIFRINQVLGHEASEYFYNRYLFNIIGTKHDCLIAYKPFMMTLKKYSRDAVRMDAFGNGRQSQTMCISLQAGQSKLAVLRSRRRGVPMPDEEIQTEMLKVEKEAAARKASLPLRFASCISKTLLGCLGPQYGHTLFSQERMSIVVLAISSILVLFLALQLGPKFIAAY